MAESVGAIYYDIEMDVRGLLTAQQRVNARLDSMERRFENTGRAVNSAERSISSAGQAMSRLTGIASALMAALSVQQVGAYADAWTQLNNKVANSVRAGEQQADVMQRIFDISQATQSSLNGTATLYARLERGTRNYNTSATDLAKLTTIINQGFAVSGATAQEAENAIVQLSQGLAAGALRGEEFNSVSEQGSRLTIALADSLGVSLGQLRAMAAQGKLTTDVIVNGLLSQGDAIGKEFANTTVTISQGLLVAGNNLTKFFGENSTVKSFAAGFRDSVITVSENLETLSYALAAVSIAMGSRFASALTIATAAKIKSTMASIQQASADRQLAKDELGAASAVQRRAIVEKEAAIAERDRALSTLASLKATNASTVAEVAHADAELVSIRTNLQQIQAEKALEIQRAKAQITEQGRIATATRMAQLRQAESVLTQQLSRAEAAAQNARAVAYAAASAQISAANSTVITTTAAATAANGALSASQSRLSATSITLASALRTVNSALSPLGGVAGIVMIIAAGWYLYAQNQAQARQESIAFADTLPDVIKKLKEMNLAQAQGIRADTIDSIKAQKEAIADKESAIESISADYEKYTSLARQYGVTEDENNGYVIKAREAANQLAKARRDLDGQTSTLRQTEESLRLVNIQVNQGIVDQMRAARDNAIALAEAEKKTSLLGGSQALLAEKLGISTQALEKFNAESLKINWGGSDGEKLIKQAERRLALSKLEGKAQAELQATYDAEDAKITDPLAIDRLKAVYAETEAVKGQKKATKESNEEGKKAASQAESIAQKLAALKQQSELAASSTEELSREQSILNAQLSLGKGATQSQISLAGEYAAKKWDTANAIKAQAAAEKLLPESKENASYQQDVKDLNTALAAKKISQEQYNATSERIEQQHQINLAKIRAQKVVTPQQQAAGEVDPVQQLANQHAEQLALIQQFETQKGQITQRGLELMNAANTQYEQQRVAAQWAIFTQQSVGYEALGAAVDSFGQGAGSALSSVITGTQSASDAARSLANTVLTSVIQAFVDMGIQQAKSAIMGATVQQSAIAATTAASVAGTATTTAASTTAAATTATAWTPAAIVASIGSFGGAAAIGIGAVIAAMALSSSIAGKRKNGGSVSAGSMYQVGESGLPEIYKASNGRQYMIPGDSGKVISNKDIQGGGGSGWIVNVNNYTSSQVTPAQSQDGSQILDILITDAENGGAYSSTLQSTFGLTRQANGDY